MSYKFLWLYIVGGTIGLLLVVFRVIENPAELKTPGTLIELIPGVLLFYLAYKVYLEKRDKDIM